MDTNATWTVVPYLRVLSEQARAVAFSLGSQDGNFEIARSVINISESSRAMKAGWHECIVRQMYIPQYTPTKNMQANEAFLHSRGRPQMHQRPAMGWSNSNLYEFRMRDVGFGLPDLDWGEGPIDARKVSLLLAVQDTRAKSFKYLYDFGDGWEHSIKIERIFPAIGEEKPMLLEATGHCPPEDIGGHGDTKSSARRLQIQRTSDMPNSSNGGAAAIMMPSASTSPNSTKPLMI